MLSIIKILSQIPLYLSAESCWHDSILGKSSHDIPSHIKGARAHHPPSAMAVLPAAAFVLFACTSDAQADVDLVAHVASLLRKAVPDQRCEPLGKTVARQLINGHEADVVDGIQVKLIGG